MLGNVLRMLVPIIHGMLRVPQNDRQAFSPGANEETGLGRGGLCTPILVSARASQERGVLFPSESRSEHNQLVSFQGCF